VMRFSVIGHGPHHILRKESGKQSVVFMSVLFSFLICPVFLFSLVFFSSGVSSLVALCYGEKQSDSLSLCV